MAWARDFREQPSDTSDLDAPMQGSAPWRVRCICDAVGGTQAAGIPKSSGQVSGEEHRALPWAYCRVRLTCGRQLVNPQLPCSFSWVRKIPLAR